MGDAPRLRILHLEDDPADAELIAQELGHAGIACDLRQVSTGVEYESALGRAAPDLILSDLQVAGYDGLVALRRARELAPGVPFVFVSGTIGEAAAIEAMRDGAADYVLKGWLARLGPVIERVRTELDLRRDLEAIRQQHHHGQKLEAMGQIAGAVAHDFRNILSVVMGHAELLLLRLPPGDPTAARLRTILDAGQRGVDLSAQLLAFGRNDPAVPVDLDPVTEVRRTETLLRTVLTRGIELKIKAVGVPGAVRADRGQFGQVLMNLLVNARDAMPKGGGVTITVARRTLAAMETFVASVAVPGDYVEISVADTGTGMPAEVQARIFEPFFTTKSAAQGTGLGLAIVYRIVRGAGGHLQVASVPGTGTTFRLLFPVAGSPGCGHATAAGGPPAARTVLVAEDDTVLREQLGQVLELAGFTVLSAGDGLEALEAVGRHAGPIVLLLTDLHMPRMGGRDLAARFAQLRPDTPILAMTGSDSGVPAAAPVTAVMRKPFSPGELVARVQAALAGAP